MGTVEDGAEIDDDAEAKGSDADLAGLAKQDQAREVPDRDAGRADEGIAIKRFSVQADRRDDEQSAERAADLAPATRRPSPGVSPARAPAAP